MGSTPLPRTVELRLKTFDLVGPLIRRIRHLVETTQRIIGQRRGLGPARTGKAVLGVVPERREAVRGQVAVRVPRQGAPVGARDLRDLVATVRRVSLVDGRDRVIVRAVGLGARGHLTGGVVREPDAEVVGLSCAVEVVADRRQAGDVVEQYRGDGARRVPLDADANRI